jgi:hypothetical protein
MYIKDVKERATKSRCPQGILKKKNLKVNQFFRIVFFPFALSDGKFRTINSR